MRKKVLLVVVFMSFIMASICFAQGAPELKGVNAPAQPEETKTIFSFKKEIGLTDEQENKIKALLFDNQNLLNSKRNTVNTLGTELAEMINKKEDMKRIKSKLEEISKIQVEMTCYDIENSRKIESVLSPTQLEKWKGIKEQATSQPKK